jgi:hypothetical protein
VHRIDASIEGGSTASVRDVDGVLVWLDGATTPLVGTATAAALCYATFCMFEVRTPNHYDRNCNPNTLLLPAPSDRNPNPNTLLLPTPC